MVNPVVYPPEAAQAGCQASYDSAGVINYNPGSASVVTNNHTFYRLRAKAAVGWRFVHFEYTKVSHRLYGQEDTLQGIFLPEPLKVDGWWVFPGINYSFRDDQDQWGELNEEFVQWGQAFDNQTTYSEIIECKAIFEPDPTGEILCGHDGRVLFGNAGTVLYK